MTLRARLACALGLIGVVLVVSCVAILGVVRSSLIDEIDRQLSAAVPMVGSPMGQQLRALGRPEDLGPPAGSPFTDLFIGELGPDGHLDVLLSPTANGDDVPVVDLTTARERATEVTKPVAYDTDSSTGGSRFRVMSVVGPTDRVTVLALSAGSVDATYHRVQVGVAVVAVILFVALALAGWWVERLGIRPIKRVTDAAAAIAAGDVDHRVEPQPSGTEAGQLADAFNVMVDERQSADRQLRQFVADASHELRTPLTTIGGVLELHRSGQLPAGPELDEALRRASQETARMSGLVADLLLLAHLDQGRPLDEQQVDLGSLAADAAFDASLLQRGRSVSTDIDPTTIVLGDEQRLRQVVTNLVTNALTYTPVDGHIELGVHHRGDVCVLEVRDDGPGMTEEQAARVFDRFFRADTGRSRSSGGAGLGLSIVASIVAAHHGEVSVETAPGEGALFRVVLPSAPARSSFEETSRVRRADHKVRSSP